jgi:hypothetical protein
MAVADADRDLCRLGRRLLRRMILIVNIELIYGRCAHLRSPFPGIGESAAGGEAAQCFDPLTTRGFTRVARGRYPIWGCSGLQQHTRLPTRLRGCREQGYTIDRGKDYRVERYQHDCSGFTDEASHRDRC